jgi:hypothetical protein
MPRPVCFATQRSRRLSQAFSEAKARGLVTGTDFESRQIAGLPPGRQTSQDRVKDQPRQYGTAAASRVALETRLNAIATAEKVDLQRLRRQISFDRLLARFFAERQVPEK